VLTRGDRNELKRLPGPVYKTCDVGHSIGLKARGRNARIAEQTGVTDRSVRRHCAFARRFGIHMPVALPGRRPRSDYSTSRRGYRRRRGERRPTLDPWTRAAQAQARVTESATELERAMRHVAAVWPEAGESECAAAVRLYLDAGGHLGPEAERWWRFEVPRLELGRAHTPWRAAASKIHLGPWLARRRERERTERTELARDARERAYERERDAEQPLTAEQIEALRIAALGKIRRV
jgi:hypothetical protein